MRRYACSFDWDRTLNTCDPQYYHWNQWLFLQMFERGLAYRKDSSVNWCPNDQTVLANEQVVNGRCERCDAVVTKKKLTQWYLRITDYAERLLDDMAQLEGKWPDKVLTMQRNWIGRSTGAEVAVRDRGPRRAGHRLHDATGHAVRRDVLRRGRRLRPGRRTGAEGPGSSRSSRTTWPRCARSPRSTGCPPSGPRPGSSCSGTPSTRSTGSACRSTPPTTCWPTTAPARSWRFRRTTSATWTSPAPSTCPVRVVVAHDEDPGSDRGGHRRRRPARQLGSAGRAGHGRGGRDGHRRHWQPRAGAGAAVNYRLRDWLISRQRYWGTPIPIIHCPQCGEVPVPEDQLPVAAARAGGSGPAAQGRRRRWVRPPSGSTCRCPRCAAPAQRDTDTMDTFVDSSWYFLRYLDPQRTDAPFDPVEARSGCRWTSTWAASPTRSCTCCTRASSPRCCTTWAWSTSPSRSPACSTRAWS